MLGNGWKILRALFAGVVIGTDEISLRSSNRTDDHPSNENNNVGFRPVEVVPEPATVGMLAISGLLIAGYRRFKKHYSL